MHVLQWIAVQAENDDEAMMLVEGKLQAELGSNEFATNSWFDWFVIGGGRFNPDQDPYQSSSNMIVHSKDRDKFDKTIVDVMLSRVDEFNSYRKSFEAKDLDLSAKLDSYTGEMRYDFELYELKKMIDMIQGEWDMNSYFFDIHHESTNVNHMQNDLDLNPDMWYLVPVDFHF
jgi:hypothetical protein